MHTFDLGDIVTVFNQRLDGTFFIEGCAKIVGYTSDVDESYFVKFLRCGKPEGKSFPLLVDPAVQDDPQAHLLTLNASIKAG